MVDPPKQNTRFFSVVLVKENGCIKEERFVLGTINYPFNNGGLR